MDNQKKRNLLIIGSSQGSYGGIEAFMIAIAEAASHWPEFNVKLCLKLVKGFAFGDDLKAIAEKACSSVKYISRGSGELLKIVAWADVLHVQNTPPDVILAAKAMRKKIFLTVHNRRMTKVDLHFLLWGFAIKFADARWFNSNFVWNSWEPGEKSKNSACVPTVCKFPQGWCPPENRKGFLFVGRWIQNKGIEEILKAYKLNNFSAEQFPLTILGDGPMKPKILALIKELGLADVSMPGFVDDKLKDLYLSTALWLLAPANTNEDLGLTPIEARSVGVPAIVTKDGGLPEAGGPSAMIAQPGSVEDLAKCMLLATKMSLPDYIKRADLAKKSLETYLKPIEFYRNQFLN